jgi:hypothetical protein
MPIVQACLQGDDQGTGFGKGKSMRRRVCCCLSCYRSLNVFEQLDLSPF